MQVYDTRKKMVTISRTNFFTFEKNALMIIPLFSKSTVLCLSFTNKMNILLVFCSIFQDRFKRHEDTESTLCIFEVCSLIDRHKTYMTSKLV
jgi:hypothetical protein